MSENGAVNRVEIELSQLQSREERFKKIFGFEMSDNKSLLKEKLYNFDRIRVRYQSSKNLEEQFTLRILKLERNRLLKKAYPNFFIRVIRGRIEIPLSETIKLYLIKKRAEENFRSLQGELQRIGLPDLSTQIKKFVNQNIDKFDIQSSSFINEKEKIDHQLYFAKSQEGNYQLDGFRTVLTNEKKPEEKREHYFSIAKHPSLNTLQVYNLLSGRAIEDQGNWIKFDLNDKDSNNNYKLKEFQRDYGYNLEEVLNKLPLKELQSKIEVNTLINGMKEGKSMAVTLKNGSETQHYVEADPQFKTVKIYDANFRKTSLSAVFGNKALKAENQSRKSNTPNRQSEYKTIHLSK